MKEREGGTEVKGRRKGERRRGNGGRGGIPIIKK
jgi:hypothetical protein